MTSSTVAAAVVGTSNHNKNILQVEATSRSTPEEQLDEKKSFDRLTATGVEGGLFQACMKAIRTAHFQSNRTRAFLVVAGLFTDVKIYREVIACFYTVTASLERKLIELRKLQIDNDEVVDPICNKIASLGYRFTEAYEADLAFLYGHDWKEEVERAVMKNSKVVDYLEKIQGMTSGAEIAGGIFVLWGALIIGGGAAAMPRVKKLCGEEATHLFQSVTGQGREERKRAFVEAWDSLPTLDTKTGRDTEKSFAVIVQSSRDCMQGNNDILTSLKRNPWWLTYMLYASGIFASASISLFWIRNNGASLEKKSFL